MIDIIFGITFYLIGIAFLVDIYERIFDLDKFLYYILPLSWIGILIIFFIRAISFKR